MINGFRAVSPRSAEDFPDLRRGRYPPFAGTTRCPRRQESPGCPFPASAHLVLGRSGNRECNCHCPSRTDHRPDGKESAGGPVRPVVVRTRVRRRETLRRAAGGASPAGEGFFPLKRGWTAGKGGGRGFSRGQGPGRGL